MTTVTQTAEQRGLSDVKRHLLEYLYDVQHKIEYFGLCSPYTARVLTESSEWVDILPRSDGEDRSIVAYVDEIIDGYYIQPRKPLALLKSCWVLYYTGYDLEISWIDERGWISVTLLDDKYYMRDPRGDMHKLKCVRALVTYGAYPLKEDFLPPLAKSMMIDEA